MPATKVQLTGGAFQDSEGNVLNLGYLKMKLNQDALISGVGNVCAGIEITINLNSSGSVITSPAQSVWGTDQMTPVNAYYRVTGYKANGQLAWGPNNQQVTGSGGTFDVGTWVPNRVISWVPSVQSLALEVNDTPNSSQALFDLVDSATVTWTDGGSGRVHATATATPLELEVNGTPNASQTELDFVNSATVTWTDNGDGSVHATAAISAASGSNIIPGNIFAGVQSSQRNSTIFVCLPAAALLFPVSSFKLVLHVCGSGTGPMTVGPRNVRSAVGRLASPQTRARIPRVREVVCQFAI